MQPLMQNTVLLKDTIHFQPDCVLTWSEFRSLVVRVCLLSSAFNENHLDRSSVRFPSGQPAANCVQSEKVVLSGRCEESLDCWQIGFCPSNATLTALAQHSRWCGGNLFACRFSLRWQETTAAELSARRLLMTAVMSAASVRCPSSYIGRSSLRVCVRFGHTTGS